MPWLDNHPRAPRWRARERAGMLRLDNHPHAPRRRIAALALRCVATPQDSGVAPSASAPAARAYSAPSRRRPRRELRCAPSAGSPCRRRRCGHTSDAQSCHDDNAHASDALRCHDDDAHAFDAVHAATVSSAVRTVGAAATSPRSRWRSPAGSPKPPPSTDAVPRSHAPRPPRSSAAPLTPEYGGRGEGTVKKPPSFRSSPLSARARYARLPANKGEG